MVGARVHADAQRDGGTEQQDGGNANPTARSCHALGHGHPSQVLNARHSFGG
jgi:hypothetical protein